MLGLKKSRAGSPKPAPQPAEPGRDVVSPFPRGLPDNDPRKPVATARWRSSAEAFDLLGEWKPGRFLVGRDSGGRYAGYDDDRHVLSVSGSRAGKGVSLIVPALTFWPGSCIAVDPKGELATITASRRSDVGSEWSVPMGGKVFALDPFLRVTGPGAAYRGAFNPLADLDADSDDGLDLAGQIADALVIQQKEAGAHWTLSARSFLRGLILYVAKTALPDSKNLLRVRELLMQGKDDINTMLEDMKKYPGVIARSGNSLSSKPDVEKWSILSTCDVQTDFLEGEPMRRVLGRSDFRLEDLKRERVTVYLCLPANRLATHGRWLRLLVSMALEAMERTGPIERGDHPVLFVLDEFAALGHMESIEKAAGQIASFGVKLWPVIQDLNQLKRDYGDAWETFMGNAGLLTFFGNTDLMTVDHISKRLGECEVIRTVVNTQENWTDTAADSSPSFFGAIFGQGAATTTQGRNEGGNRSNTENLMKARLMNPDELVLSFAREAGNILAFTPNLPPLALHRCVYFSAADDGLFGGLFDPAPGMPPPSTKAETKRARQLEADRARRA